MAKDIESVRLRMRRRGSIKRPKDAGPRLTLAEIATPAIVLVVLALGAYEFGRFHYVRSSVHQQFAEAARFAAKGESLTDPETGEQMSRARSVTQYIEAGTKSLPVTIETISLDPADGGKPGDVVQIEARYRLVTSPLMRLLVSSDGQFFTESAVVKNQPAL